MGVSPIQLTPGMDPANMASAINDNFRQVEAESRTKIITDDQGVDRVLIGRDPDGKYGIKVSKPDKDVTTASGNDLFFNSNQSTFNVVKVMDITFSATFGAITGPRNQGRDNTQLQTFAHGLDFVPVVVWTVIVPGPDGNSASISAGSIVYAEHASNYADTIYWTLNVNKTNLTIGHFRRFWLASGLTLPALGTNTSTVRAYLLQQSATT